MKRTITYFLAIILILILFFLTKWAISPEVSPDWTGFGSYDEDKLGPRSKTLWDWLDLLIVPLVLAIAALLFKEFEKTKASNLENFTRQNIALDNFIKIITELNLNYGLTSDNPQVGADDIARSRVHFVLNSLDASSKGQVLQFLYESNLINIDPRIKLIGANLRNALLDGIVLENSEIKGAYFTQASLTNSNLNNSILIGSDFTQANLSDSQICETDLSYANLTKSKLRNMDLTTVKFEGATLNGADLSGSNIKKEQLQQINNKKGIKINNANVI